MIASIIKPWLSYVSLCCSAQTFFCKKCEQITEFMNVSEYTACIASYMINNTVLILQYFHDKAAAKEIDYLSVSCPYGKCKWSGEYRLFQVSKITSN